MITKRVIFALLAGSCALDPPPEPKPIDCASDRAALRYPDECGGDEADGGLDADGGAVRDEEPHPSSPDQ